MLLIGVKSDSGWLSSRWNLTYRVGWEHICKEADYEKFNKSLCQYMDSIELAMYR